MGSWKGTVDILSMPLDDFDFIPDNDFFHKAKVALLPHLNEMFIMDETQPCYL